MKRLRILGVKSVLSLVAVFGLSGCSTKSPTEPTDDGFITGAVLNSADSSGINNANVVVFNANTNAPVTRAFSDSAGKYFYQLPSDVYYIKVFAQGYDPSPPIGGQPVSFQVAPQETTLTTILLDVNASFSNTGSVSGTVWNESSDGIPGALVVAKSTDGQVVQSTSSGPDGFYVMFNVPPGTYSLQAFVSGFNQDPASIQSTISAGAASGNQDITLHTGAAGGVTGHVSFVAVSNPNFDVDVTVIHPDTREAIPGLSAFIQSGGGDYAISSIPMGRFLVWASYRNDGLVIDPDALFRQGEPYVNISSASFDTTIDFKVTGAVQITEPTNLATSLFPVIINTTEPEFTWSMSSSYSSAKEFIVEVFNQDGRVIWGGFDSTGVIRHPQIRSGQTSAVYNFDNSASEPLESGRVYRWKVYADDNADANVQTLLSSSEDLMGLFQVQLE